MSFWIKLSAYLVRSSISKVILARVVDQGLQQVFYQLKSENRTIKTTCFLVASTKSKPINSFSHCNLKLSFGSDKTTDKISYTSIHSYQWAIAHSIYDSLRP